MLKQLRDKIDELDNQIIELLEKRFKVTNKISTYKKENNINVEDKNREQNILKKTKSDKVKLTFQKIFEINKCQK
jgi:chorismate mutase